MYEYIVGLINKITPRYIVLENNGIGYSIMVPNPYNFTIGENLKVYTYQYIRDQINDLYGFKSEEEKELFIKLISVTGIGPKSALSILASGKVKDVYDAIEARNDAYLRKFPGIGPKASQQIILDLKGKLNFDVVSSVSLTSQKENDCIEALISLGYSKKDIEKIIKKVNLDNDEANIIKEALALLSK